MMKKAELNAELNAELKAELKAELLATLHKKMISEIQDYAIILLDIDGTILTWYQGIRGFNWSWSGGKFTQDTGIIMKWHRQDPPDAFEIARHEYIASVQHNRNPFIDYPQWAGKINFSNMSYISGGDTSQPKVPKITLLEPTSQFEISGFGPIPIKIKWHSENIDSVDIYFSFDSLKNTAFIKRAGSTPDSTFVPANMLGSYPSHGHGIFLLKDYKSSAADTGDYFIIHVNDGLNDLSSLHNVHIYPNPSTGKFMLSTVAGHLEMEVYDAVGKSLLKRISDSNTVELQIEKPGIYFLKISDGSGQVIRKLVVE